MIGRIVFAACAALAALMPVRAARADRPTVAGVRVFVGDDNGEQVTIVKLSPAEEHGYLIKFEGVDGDWDGAIVPHTLSEGGTGGDKRDYKTRVAKREYVSVTGRSSGGSDVYEVHPKGGRSARIRYSQRRTEQATEREVGEAILAEYEASQAKLKGRGRKR